MAAGEACGDILRDFRTEKGRLSLWTIDDSNLDRVIAAVAATKKNVEQVDFVLFPEELLESVGIKVQQVNGNTPDPVANRTWHFDILELTVRHIAVLAAAINERGELGRKHEPDIKQLLRDGLESLRLEESLMKPELVAKLRPKP